MPHTEKANHAAESTPLLRGGQPLKPYRRGRVARVITRVTVVGGFLLIALVAILNLVLPRVHIPSRVAPTSYNIQAALAAYAGDSLGNLYPTTIADWAELVRIVNAHGSALKPNAADMYIKSIQYASDGCDYRLTITTTDKRVTPPNNTFVVTPEGVARGAQEPQDLLGCTALMRAVMQGDVATVHALLQAGADVQARDQQGRTALMIAAARGSSIVHAILQAGADVQARDQQGRTALMDIPQLQAGADVHAQVQKGQIADSGLTGYAGRLRPRSTMEADHGQADGFAMLAGEVDNSWKPPLNGACTSTLAGADRQRSLALRIGADRQRQGALRMCIPAVLVYDSGEMAFHVTWRVEKLPIGSNGIKKESDVGNRNMYVLDNLGNRYDHIALDGAARDGGTAGYGSDLSGAFLFPPAQPGAFRFQFVDADQGVAIANIDLRPPAP